MVAEREEWDKTEYNGGDETRFPIECLILFNVQIFI